MASQAVQQKNHKDPLRPSFLNKFVSLDACPRFFKFKYENAAEDHINHDPGDFTEAFHGGNVIERNAGNDFEDDIVRVISENISDAFDIDALTLSMTGEAIPKKLASELEPLHTGTELTPETVSDGEFTYHGVDSTNIVLNDVDAFLEQTPDNEPIDSDRINSAFRNLRVAFTETLFDELIHNVTAADLTGEIPFTTPRHAESPVESPGLPGTGRADDDPIIVLQPSFHMDIGTWSFAGDADIVFIWPTASDENHARVRVVDIKHSLEEQTQHQIQAVTYTQAIDSLESLRDTQLTIEAGIISQRSSFFPLTPDGVPEFDRESREMDLHRLTRDGGTLDALFNTPFDETHFQLDSKCTSCEFNEACYTVAIENAGLELLGINRGAQGTLRENGIADLHDLAELADPIEDVHPVKDDQPKITHSLREKYASIAGEAAIGDRLPQLIQQAQVYLYQLQNDSQYANKSRNPVHLLNSGYGTLPDDSYILGADDGLYREGSMVRVYLNVQHDHIRDMITGVSYYVTATASTAEPVNGVVIDENISQSTVESHHDEHELLETLADDVFEAIETVGDGIDLTGYMQENPFVHFFTFARDEAETLEKHLAKYVHGELTLESSVIEEIAESDDHTYTVEISASKRLRAFQNLLGQRSGADQPMVSAVHDDITARMAVRQPTTGMVNIFWDFYGKTGGGDPVVPNSAWEYTPDDPSRLPPGTQTIDLKKAFGYRMFSNSLQYRETLNGIELLHGSDTHASNNYYGSRVRNGAQIPLPYVWAGTGALTDRWDEDEIQVENVPIDSFRYHSKDDADVKITTEDIKELMKYLARCLARIEQGIPERSLLYMGDKDETESGSGDTDTTGEVEK